jgi:hypothetical protein
MTFSQLVVGGDKAEQQREAHGWNKDDQSDNHGESS